MTQGSTAAGRDAGRVSIFLAIAITGVVMVFGVAVDATGQLRTLVRADNIAAEAARAAGQGLDVDLAAQAGGRQISQDRAFAYAAEYLAAAGHNLPNSDWDLALVDGGTAVEATVVLTYQPRILGLFGKSEVRVTARSVAVLVSEP